MTFSAGESLQSFSQAIDILLVAENVRGRQTGSLRFPAGLMGAQKKIHSGESPRQWFVRMLNLMGHNPDLCRLESNMAMFLDLDWKDGNVTYMNCQILVVGTDLDTYYLDDDTDHWSQYFRLDLDYKSLGKMFSHPLPHIHTVPADAPRFSLELQSGNVFMDFFDFLYRNYKYEQWVEWAERTWRKFVKARVVSIDCFDPIRKAFEAEKKWPELVNRFENQVMLLKSALDERKRNAFPHTLDPECRRVLNYGAMQ